jgi:type IV pilus assembly protein PilB
MTDMGVPGYLVSSSVIAILAQRLVRVICSKCKQPYTPPESALRDAGITKEMADGATFAKGKGCGHCSKKGYRGRIGIYELMLVTSKIRQKIFENASTQEIRKAAIAQGMSTLYNDGIDKVLKGITTLEEVYRVAKRTEQDPVVV